MQNKHYFQYRFPGSSCWWFNWSVIIRYYLLTIFFLINLTEKHKTEYNIKQNGFHFFRIYRLLISRPHPHQVQHRIFQFSIWIRIHRCNFSGFEEYTSTYGNTKFIFSHSFPGINSCPLFTHPTLFLFPSGCAS